MPCYHPIPGWIAKRSNESGKRSIVFKLAEGHADRPATVPCGSCIGCRLERARQWAVRCMHEASTHEVNSFVTLTYAENPYSLTPEHFTDFMKRLRYYHDGPVRYFQCGEYGEKLGRPHHHALLFGVWFSDSRPYLLSKPDGRFTSATLEKIWSHGRCLIGSVTFESAGYIARYTMKKVVGPAAESYYAGRVPEYLTMSRRPGIGSGYMERYGKEVYERDELVVRGHKCKPPRFYDERWSKAHPEDFRRVLARRKVAAAEDENNSGARLLVREAVKASQIFTLKRDLESGDGYGFEG